MKPSMGTDILLVKWECFYSILNEGFTADVPVVKSNNKRNSFIYPKHIRACLQKKSTAWNHRT